MTGFLTFNDEAEQYLFAYVLRPGQCQRRARDARPPRAAAAAAARGVPLREQLLKLGAWVQASVRRIVLHLPASCPRLRDWQQIAYALGAAPA